MHKNLPYWMEERMDRQMDRQTDRQADEYIGLFPGLENPFISINYQI